MTQTAQHTATPWKQRGTDVDAVVDGHTSTIAECFDHASIDRRNAEANAAFIVRACNSYQTMLDALQMAKAAILDANRNGFTRGIDALSSVNSAIEAAGSKP